MTTQLSVTITGANVGELASKALAFAQEAQTGAKLGKAPAGKKATKQAAPEEDLSDDLTDDLADDVSDDVADDAGEDSFDDVADDADDVVEETPKKTAKGKAAKLTEKDVNTAALAHAEKHTRPKTLSILAKHFNVKSIQELKPAQYEKAITVLKV